MYYQSYVFHMEGKVTTGTIVEKSRRLGRDSSNNLTIEYVMPGTPGRLKNTVMYVPDDEWKAYNIGDEIRIVYHPKYKSHIYQYQGKPVSIMHILIPMILIFGFCSLLLTASAINIIWKRVFHSDVNSTEAIKKFES